MKHRILLFIAIVFLSLNSFAQNTNNIVVFSQSGERFYVILNGVRQNIEPETNVKIVNLDQPTYKMKVIFENKSLPNVDRTLPFGSFGLEFVFEVAQNKKGDYKIRYISEAPIKKDAALVPDQEIVYYGQPADTIVTTTTTTTTTSNTPSDNIATTTSNTDGTLTTTTTANTNITTTNTNGISINVNENGMSVNGIGVDVNVQTTGTGMNTNTQMNETTTTNTSSSNSVSSDNSSRFVDNGVMCSYATLSKDQFVKLKFAIDEKSLVTKMDFTKDNVKKNCMEAAQIAELVKLFDYSTDQLELAKFSYQYTYDTKNYDLVVNALSHDYNKPKLLDVIGTSTGSSTTTTVPVNETTTTTTVVEEKVIVSGTNNTTTTTGGCYTPMADADFQTAKKSIESKSFEDSRLTLAKQIMKNKCLSVQQVKEIMLLFSFEQTRLDFAKLAYDYTSDRDNYYQLNDAFTFESSIDELNTYLESK